MSLELRLLLFILIINEVFYLTSGGNIPPAPTRPPIKVYKCCKDDELMHESRCVNVSKHNVTPWVPLFTDERGRPNVQIKENYKLVIGIPQCGSRQAFSIFYYRGSSDKLSLLPSGRLRHYFLQHPNTPDEFPDMIDDELDPDNPNHRKFFDYDQGLYCMDKVRIKY